MTDRELITSFDKTASVYRSSSGTEMVEYKVLGSNYFTTDKAATYAGRIRSFQKRGW